MIPLMKRYFKAWWNWLRFEPGDPRLAAGGATVKIAVIGGGTGLANLLRGLKVYSGDIAAVVTVADRGGSTAQIRKDFDMQAPGDIRKCIGALAHNEELFSRLLEHRFKKDKKTFGGHTLGNIWITALSDYFGSFERAVEVTSEVFQTSGRVLPSTLANVDIRVEYDDETLKGEHFLDELLKPIKKISLTKPFARAYKKAVQAIKEADLIVVGPGSLYGSILPNLLIGGISEAINKNKNAVRVYVANCSTERTQTRNFTVENHIQVIHDHTKKKLFDYCLVNSRILKKSRDETKLGAVRNITTTAPNFGNIRIVRNDLISEKNPLFHDSAKLAKSLIELYNEVRHET